MTALQHLQELAPPPPRPCSVDWADIRAETGLTFPRDYVELCESYGPGTFGDAIDLFVPGATNPALDLIARTRGMNEVIAAWREDTPIGFTEDVPANLIAWGDGPDVEFLTWNSDGDPDRWPVLLVDPEEFSTWTFPITVTEAILGFLTDTLDQPVIKVRGGGFASGA
jgi:hypothetical protein